MTRDQIIAGLEVLTLRLANNEDMAPPPHGLELHEWAYIKGVASGEILRLRARILEAGPR